MAETISASDGRRTRAPRGGTALPVLALECERPLAPPMCVELDGWLAIGRGPERRIGGGRLEVPDARMSVSHARLVREADDWFVEDLGSKNGTLLNGQRATRAMVRDQDLI